MTAKVSYRLRAPVPLDAELTLRGTLVRRGDRGFRAAVTIHLPDGTLAAEGEGTCMLLPDAAGAPDAAWAGAT
jgi:acyl-coenzyme A thioesterase PaaI-like protein